MKFKKIPGQIAKTLLLAGVLLPSCIGDNFNLDNLDTNSKIPPSYATHLAHASLSFKDLIPENDTIDQFLELNDEGYFELYYQKELYNLTAAEQVVVPDQNFEQSLSLGETELANFNFALNIEVNRDYDYNFQAPQGMHLDHLMFKSGTMHIVMQSEWAINIGIGLTLPGFTSNNGADTLKLDISDLNNNPYDQTIDLSGYTIDLTNNFSAFNQIAMKYLLSLSQDAGTTSSPDDQISVSVTIENIAFDLVQGYFGKIDQVIADNTFPLGFANNLFDAEVHLENPQFNIFYTNSFGLPVQFAFNSLYAINSDNQQVDITFSDPDLDPIQLNTPTQPGDSLSDTLSINGLNSNLFDVILSFPKSVTFGGTVQLNAGVDSTTYDPNFLPGDGKFDITAEFRLPLSASFKIALQDTIPFAMFNDTLLVNQIDQVEMKIGIDNGFPIDLGLQVYFADSVNTVLDSLFDQFSIVGSNSNIPTHNDLNITITNEQLNNIKPTKFLMVKAVVASTGFDAGQFVHITDQYEVGFDFAVKIDLNVNPADFNIQDSGN
ncbi:MAG: hypothetical protein GXO79_04235 [Chlorobi bacterium]|nr:hypothetical protein [Chlorobiota bacterium]